MKQETLVEIRRAWALRSVCLCMLLLLPAWLLSAAEVVSFPSGSLTLHGALYKPEGTGPFPAVVYNHGSAPGMLSREAFDQKLETRAPFTLPASSPRRTRPVRRAAASATAHRSTTRAPSRIWLQMPTCMS